MEPQSQPINSNSQSTTESAKKCKHMPIIIILAILAVAGIGFGGFEFWQNAQKNEEIKNLQAENIKVEEREYINNETHSEYENNLKDRELNPIISASDPNQTFTITKNFHIYDYNTSNDYSLKIGLKDGDISACELYSVTDNISSLQYNCDIANISGKIYKADYLGYGQMGNPKVVFIMQDGTAKYFSLDDALVSSNISVESLKANGFVVDAINEIGVRVDFSGYITSALVYSDGTYETYESLFAE